MLRVHTSTAGDGPLIVCVHDAGDAAAAWSSLQTELAVSYQVVTFDLLGHGDSPIPPDPRAYDLEATLADIDDVIAEFRVGPEIPALVGHRFGALLARAYAANRPGMVGELILIEPEDPPVDVVDRVLTNDTRAARVLDEGITEAASWLARLPIEPAPVFDVGRASVPTLELDDAMPEDLADSIDRFIKGYRAPDIDLRTGRAEPVPVRQSDELS